MKGRHAKDSGAWKKVTLVAGVATTGAIPLAVVSAPSAQAAPVSAWDKIAECESNGRWNLPYGHADSTGGLQIQQRTWNDFNGQQYAAMPYQATKAEQIAVAEKILARQGPSAWACNSMVGYPLSSSGPNSSSLEGGEKAYPDLERREPAKPKAPSTGGTYVVQAGDSLYLIAKAELGDGEKWPVLYKANKEVVGDDPDLILPGQKLTIPGASKPSVPQSSSKGEGVVNFVKGELGKPYVLGGNGPSVWDCSGLTLAAYKRYGVNLPRVSQQQSLQGTGIPVSQAQPGDLLYWGAPGSAHHVAVYVGDGKFVGAQNPSVGVVEKPLTYSQPTGARRIL